MSEFVEFIDALVPRFKFEEALGDPYLSESGDLCDLEHRMRQIDCRTHSTSWALILRNGAR